MRKGELDQMTHFLTLFSAINLIDDTIISLPGSNFVYSFANPAIAGGLLTKTTGMSYAQYLDTHLFPILGISRSQWRWVGDREGNSQPDGCSYHTAQNLAKLAYLLLRGGRWQVIIIIIIIIIMMMMISYSYKFI